MMYTLVDQQFGYAAPLLDRALAGISTEFSGTITTQFSFTYTLHGVTAMPRGLHARLCHAFLVSNNINVRSLVQISRPAPFLLSYSDFDLIFFLIFFVSGPCARLSWPSRQLLSARYLPYRIVSYPNSSHSDSFVSVDGTEKLMCPVGRLPRRHHVFNNHRPEYDEQCAKITRTAVHIDYKPLAATFLSRRYTVIIAILTHPSPTHP